MTLAAKILVGAIVLVVGGGIIGLAWALLRWRDEVQRLERDEAERGMR